ncbi:MAG: hypothetical protein WKF55_15710 [Gemmatimonadaceae bacterium]
MDRYCRICWNTENWRRPSGDAQRYEQGTFVATHGFGHEEWLLNPEWEIDGYRYGFLQPINKARGKLEDTVFSVSLYTRRPDGDREAVAILNNLYVPRKAELQSVKREYRRRGWLDQMGDDLQSLNIRRKAIESAPVDSFVNVRLQSTDVKVFDPRPEIVPGHALTTTSFRYIPYKWDGGFAAIEGSQPKRTTGKMGRRPKSEETRPRRAIGATEINPQHSRLQNELKKLLDESGKSVSYEENNVDLVVRDGIETVFYEIKMALTVKGCIREAVGQLLEYTHFPDLQLASKLVVVGSPAPDDKEREYLRHLRALYHIPLYYAQFEQTTKILGPEI